MAQPHVQLCSLLPVSSWCECAVSSNHHRPTTPPCYPMCEAYPDTVRQHSLSSRCCFWKVFLSQKVTNIVLLAWLETSLSEAPLSSHRMLNICFAISHSQSHHLHSHSFVCKGWTLFISLNQAFVLCFPCWLHGSRCSKILPEAISHRF